MHCPTFVKEVQPNLSKGARSGGGGVWAMAGVQGKVAFGLSHFCIEVFQKKFRPANFHEDPNLTMHWHRQMGNVAG